RCSPRPLSYVILPCCSPRTLPRAPALFPYTTLFRSEIGHVAGLAVRAAPAQAVVHLHRGPPALRRELGAQGFPRSALGALDRGRPEEHTSEPQSRENRVCRRLLQQKRTPGRAATGRA